jgi:type VI secretion system secreted protein Hcp
VENPTTIGSAASGAGAGKMKLDQLMIHKPVDEITASLFSASASGQRFAVVHLVLRRQAGTAQPEPFLVYEFQTALITNIAWSGSNGDPDPAEALTLAYGALRIAYKSTNSDGTLAPAVSSSWNQVTNSADIAGPSPLK